MVSAIRRVMVRAWLVMVALGGVAPGAAAQSVENVLLVVNDSSAASREIAAHYAAARGLPDSQMVHVAIDPSDEITRADFVSRLERPIGEWIIRESAHDRLLYIVLTKGIPLRIQGSIGRKGTLASVDSELTLLYRKLVGLPVTVDGPLPNPYFLGDAQPADIRPFGHDRFDIYLVTRLDGFTVDDVKALIDRGVAPAKSGVLALDRRANTGDIGDRWLEETAQRFARDPLLSAPVQSVVLDQASARDVLGYYSWGSNDPAIRQRWPDITYAPGALAGMFVGGDARTFTEPAGDWTIGNWRDPRTHFAGSPASLTGDLIRRGVTGASGSVADPFLEGSVRPSILFPAYLSGRNLAEAFYLATPFLSWQTVIIGDPLCAPFSRDPLAGAVAAPGPDAVTGLPEFFSARRVRFLALTGVSPEALRQYLRAEWLTRRGDADGARQSLEAATAADDRLAPAHAMLATHHEQAREYDKAIERYRKVLEHLPNDPTALNNLAYALAVRSNLPEQALPFAEKAYALGAANPAIADTLGWIRHLLGDAASASRLLDRAVEGLPDSAEVHLHAAIVSAAARDLAKASTLLARAVELDATLEERDDVRQLRATIGASELP